MRSLAWFVAATVAVAPSTTNAATAPAAAKPKIAAAKIAVRKLEVAGNIGPAWAGSFQSSLEAGLSAQNATVIDISNVECEAGGDACWRENAEAIGADFIVRGNVTKRDRDYRMQLELVSPSDGPVIATAEERCEPCGLAEVSELLRDVGGTLAARVDSLATAESVILFQSSPPGAVLVLDQIEIGGTPQQRGLEPGDHEVQATLDGHLPQRRRFTTVAGVDQTVRFDLTPLEREPSPHLQRLGWASLGLGGAGIIAGGVMIGIDERPVTSNCSGENVNSSGVCKFRRDTLTGGATLIAVGAAAIVAGTVIAIVTTQHRNQRRGRVGSGPGGLRLRF